MSHSHHFAAHLDIATATVCVTHHVGELRVASTVPLATYERRLLEWPGLYPEPTIGRVSPAGLTCAAPCPSPPAPTN